MSPRTRDVLDDSRTRPVSRATAERLYVLAAHLRMEYNPYDFTYQACRFCKRQIGSLSSHRVMVGLDVPGLWKYGVRHYACDGCRANIISDVLSVAVPPEGGLAMQCPAKETRP